jgi:heavy metal sensor kinase
LKATVAEDTATLDYTLRTLLRVFLLSIPGALVLSITGGYFVAGRALAPVSAMAAKSREITAEALSERLPVDNPNDELGRMAMVFNETLGRLQASFERLRNFTGNVSHELRTPLTAIRSVGEVALQSPLDADSLRDVIGSMLEEVDRLTRLVDCMLGLARAEAVPAPVVRENVALADEAAAAFELVRVLADEKRQTVCVNLRRPAVVRGDAAMLRQALLNLLDNAIRYTPPGGQITVTTEHDSSGHVIVEVQDNGPGIAPGDRDRIFERFYRAPVAASGLGRGAGLGLAIARSAIEAAGGRLEYHDAQGGGSRFCIVLPEVRA